jgi:hypothetical protein
MSALTEDFDRARNVPGGLTISLADGSDKPVAVTCEQTAPIIVRPPQPKYQTIDRPGRIGIPEWTGQDPYEMIAAIRFDGYPDRSVEGQISTLESFAEVAPGAQTPPTLTLSGQVPLPHPHLKWCLTNIADPDELLFLTGGKQRCRYATTLTFTQHVDANELEQSLHATKASKGIRTRYTRVKAGEDLFAVARRFYGDPSRASDVARANFQGGKPLRMGQILTVGLRLRMPS